MEPVNRSNLDRTFAFINGKGGVGKTTLTANIAGIMAASGHRVLAVDLDTQGNLGLDLGYIDTDIDDSGRSLSIALAYPEMPVAIHHGVRENLDVVVGGPELHTAAGALARKGQAAAGNALAALLSPVAGAYDFILVDCPPGNEVLQVAAIGAARWGVIPSRSDLGGEKGLRELADRVASTEDINPTFEVLGVALFAVGRGATKVRSVARKMLADALGTDTVLFDTTIRHAEAVAQAARARGRLAHELDAMAEDQPKFWEIRAGTASGEGMIPSTATSVADDLHALALEMMARLTARETAQEVAA